MTTREGVEKFLSQFKIKLEVFDIFFLDGREKNSQALLDLNISRFERLEVVKSIQTEDYSDGPIVDDLNNFKEMWVFGKDVNGCEVYIKVAMGDPNNRTICISFHKAEHKMAYPFKQ